MFGRLSAALLFFSILSHGCEDHGSRQKLQLKYRAAGPNPEVLALYEPWFGHPRHISVGYSSHDPDVLAKQIKTAKGMGITGFVVDWYGGREPFNDQTY